MSRTLTKDEMISYAEALDVAQLFTQRRIEFTFTHIVSRFLELIEENSDNTDFTYPIVYSDCYDNLIFEYTFFVKILSEFVENKWSILA